MKIKFIQINVWGNGGIFEKALDFLVKEQPDIVCLQEVYDGQDEKTEPGFRALTLLKENLGLDYYFYSPAFTDNRDIGKIVQGNAIISRWPVIDSKATFFDKPYNEDYVEGMKEYVNLPRNIQQAVIKSGDKEVNVFNVHGVWGEDGKDNKRRLKFSQLVINTVKDKENVILAGDFNVNEGTKSISMIDEHLNNIFKGDRRKNSFNMKRKTDPGYGTAVVDYIFTSSEIKVLSHEMPKVDVTDHLPLIAELEV